jgi:hypothetical protein
MDCAGRLFFDSPLSAVPHSHPGSKGAMSRLISSLPAASSYFDADRHGSPRACAAAASRGVCARRRLIRDDLPGRMYVELWF